MGRRDGRSGSTGKAPLIDCLDSFGGGSASEVGDVDTRLAERTEDDECLDLDLDLAPDVLDLDLAPDGLELDLVPDVLELDLATDGLELDLATDVLELDRAKDSPFESGEDLAGRACLLRPRRANLEDLAGLEASAARDSSCTLEK